MQRTDECKGMRMIPTKNKGNCVCVCVCVKSDKERVLTSNVMTTDLRQFPGNNLTAGSRESLLKSVKQENAVDHSIGRDFLKK